MDHDTYADGRHARVLNQSRIQEAELWRLARAGQGVLPAGEGAITGTTAAILSRGTAAVRAFWELAFRPPQEQCC